MTLEEYIRACDPYFEDTLLEKSDLSEYWDSVYKFVMENKSRDFESLTPKQKDWAIKISEAL